MQTYRDVGAMQYILFLPTVGESEHDIDVLSKKIHFEFTELKPLLLGSIGEELDERAWIAAVCLGISRHTYERDSLHFIAFDTAVNRLPDISFASRSMHRTIHSYTFIDCLPENFLPEWPDAPVTVIITNPLSTFGQSAKLRGWNVLTIDAKDLLVTLANTFQIYAL